jgi:hypothetical protein
MVNHYVVLLGLGVVRVSVWFVGWCGFILALGWCGGLGGVRGGEGATPPLGALCSCSLYVFSTKLLPPPSCKAINL